MGPTSMDHQAADRISAAARQDPDSPAAQSGFDDRAQDAAGRNEEYAYEDDEYAGASRLTRSSWGAGRPAGGQPPGHGSRYPAG